MAIEFVASPTFSFPRVEYHRYHDILKAAILRANPGFNPARGWDELHLEARRAEGDNENIHVYLSVKGESAIRQYYKDPDASVEFLLRPTLFPTDDVWDSQNIPTFIDKDTWRGMPTVTDPDQEDDWGRPLEVKTSYSYFKWFELNIKDSENRMIIVMPRTEQDKAIRAIGEDGRVFLTLERTVNFNDEEKAFLHGYIDRLAGENGDLANRPNYHVISLNRENDWPSQFGYDDWLYAKAIVNGEKPGRIIVIGKPELSDADKVSAFEGIENNTLTVARPDITK